MNKWFSDCNYACDKYGYETEQNILVKKLRQRKEKRAYRLARQQHRNACRIVARETNLVIVVMQQLGWIEGCHFTKPEIERAVWTLYPEYGHHRPPTLQHIHDRFPSFLRSIDMEIFN